MLTCFDYPHHWRCGAAAALISACLYTIAVPSHAQVYRCIDAQGHTTYTGAPCPATQRATKLQSAPTPQEQAQQQAAYQAALQARQMQQAAREAAEQALQPQVSPQAPAQSTAQPQPQPAPLIVQIPAPNYYPGNRPPLHPPAVRPPVPMPPRPSTSDGYNCNVFRCYDGKGNTWSRP